MSILLDYDLREHVLSQKVTQEHVVAIRTCSVSVDDVGQDVGQVLFLRGATPRLVLDVHGRFVELVALPRTMQTHLAHPLAPTYSLTLNEPLAHRLDVELKASRFQIAHGKPATTSPRRAV